MDEKMQRKCCMNCKYGGLFMKCDKLKCLPEYAELCDDKLQKASSWLEKQNKQHKIMYEHCCDDFKNQWLEYPIAVKEVRVDKLEYNKGFMHKMGCLVKIRPCGEEYENKTYLGFYIGDMPTQIYQSYNREESVLTIKEDGNPAIFVPELKKIVFGYESWWSEIKSEEELKDITNDDIENVWYVKLLKNMCGCSDGDIR